MKTRIRFMMVCLMLVFFLTFEYAEADWMTLDKPGASRTYLFGIDGGNVVGYYESGHHGFLYDGTNWTTLDCPFSGASSTTAYDIDDGNIVGAYLDASGEHGFLYDGTNWVALDVPGASLTRAFGINGDKIVGLYEDASGLHSFLYDKELKEWTTLNTSGPYAQGIDIDVATGGIIVGYNPGWLYDIDTGIETEFNGPDGALAWPYDIQGSNIVGVYDESGWQGFLYNGTNWTPLNFPGALHTYPFDIYGNKIVGYYDAPGSPGHGFVYIIPTPGAVVLGSIGLAFSSWKLRRRKEL